MESITPMVGRENELEELISHLGKALVGEGSLVLVSGEAGSGKTTLCEEFAKLAVKNGGTILVGRCVPNASSPFLPFMEAFHARSTDPFADSNESVIANRGKLFLSVLDSVEKDSQHNVMIIWLEDLHWADSASVALLHFLARNIRMMNVVMLGTYRPEDIHPDLSGEKHPFQEDLRIMRREEICQEISLKPLSPGDTMKLVPLRLGGAVEQPLLDVVANDSKGNPLFAVELIKYLFSTGQISDQKGIWELRDDANIKIPSTVREVILVRVGHIPKDAKRTLECASVIGEWFGIDMIVETSNLRDAQLLESLESLENDYRLIEETDGRYKFSHEKVRQVVYEQISVQRRRSLHWSIGQSLEKRLPNDELLVQLSEHFDKANENEKCIKYSLMAGKYCFGKKGHEGSKILTEIGAGQNRVSTDPDTTTPRSSRGPGRYEGLPIHP